MRARWNQNRASFTLVELMVVVVILGILASLISAAAMAALIAARETAIKFEVDGLATALNVYKGELGDFPPDFSDVTLVEAHARTRWAKNDSAELVNIRNLNLTRAQALVFWLRSFSASPTHPYTTASQGEPRFKFDKSRLLDPATGNLPADASVLPVYISTHGGRAADGTLRPYIYFDARSYAAATYAAPTGTKRSYRSDTTADVYAAADSFQLIHAGLDEDYGQVNATASQASYPSGTNYALGDRDNITNFVKSGTRTLDDSIP